MWMILAFLAKTACLADYAVAEPGPYHHQKVAGGDTHVRNFRSMHPHQAGKTGAVRVHRPATHQRGTGRTVDVLQEPRQLLTGLRPDYPASDITHGSLGTLDQIQGHFHALFAEPFGPGRELFRDLGNKVCGMDGDILGDVDQDRALPAFLGNQEGLATVFAKSATSLTMKLCLVIGMVMPVISTSWKLSLPKSWVVTFPVIATRGMESM